MQPNDTFNEAYETLTTYYALIDHTNADSYGYLTQDMQVQKSAVHKYHRSYSWSLCFYYYM